MEKTEIVENIIESIRSEIAQFVEEESTITNSLEYEERVLELSRKFAKGLISQTQGSLPKSRNSKKKS